MNPFWQHELIAYQARRTRKALAAYAAFDARGRPQVEIENHLLFSTLVDRARAGAEVKTRRTGRRTLLRVNTQRRTVLTADGKPVPGISYDELTQALLARDRTALSPSNPSS